MKDDELLTDHIPPEIMQIINFIADKEYQYEQESKEKIKKDIFNKYGDAGLKIFDDLNTNQGEVDCPDCNCNEEDISIEEESNKNEDEILNELSLYFSNILNENPNEIITYNDLELYIKNICPKFLENINMIKIMKLLTMILSKGFEDGWLFDKFFNFDSVPKHILDNKEDEH